jgi:hypothetical protein
MSTSSVTILPSEKLKKKLLFDLPSYDNVAVFVTYKYNVNMNIFLTQT